MAESFAGRTALVTGGASGIGAAIAAMLAERGAKVASFDLSDRGLPAGVLGITGDVTEPGAADAAVDRVQSELGPLDVLVCSAGITGDSLPTTEVSDAEWQRVLRINLDGAFFFNRAAARVMPANGYGRIVNVASIAGKEGNPMAAAYSASKAGVIGMTKAIGKDLATTGVLVNCIAPAVIRTPILEQVSEEHLSYMVEKIPMSRVGDVAEVAELVAFLASDRMTFSTGATFDISGGRATY